MAAQYAPSALDTGNRMFPVSNGGRIGRICPRRTLGDIAYVLRAGRAS
jgi:hypothetical protein